MPTATVKVPGHPTKAAAQETLDLMKSDPEYVDGSGKVYQEGSTWAAEAKFNVPDGAAAAAKTKNLSTKSGTTPSKTKKKKLP